jgi:hypothetical protein
MVNDLTQNIQVEGEIDGRSKATKQIVVHVYDGEIVGSAFENATYEQKESKDTKIALV